MHIREYNRMKEWSVAVEGAYMEKDKVWSIVRSTLACDLSCDARKLQGSDICAVSSRELPGRRRFPFRPDSLMLVSTYSSLTLSCPAAWLPWGERAVAGLQERDEAFRAPFICKIHKEFALPQKQTVAGPELKFCCSSDTLRQAHLRSAVSTELVYGSELHLLHRLSGFSHALTGTTDGPRPDVLASVAHLDGRVAAIAGASADNDLMWQVGVDVLPEYRGMGLGQAVVHSLTEAILGRGVVPYYSTVLSNLASRSLAIAVGYWPAWVELHTR